MSYPTRLHVLIVEDDPSVKEYYERILSTMKSAGGRIQVRFAFCLADALELLRTDMIFHLVVVDLQIPENDGEPPPEGVLLGRTVIEECAKRDEWPVPAALVFSGRMSGGVQDSLDKFIESQFAYGKARVKDDVENIIAEAVEFIDKYCAVGIHELEKPDDPHVPLTPREKDLIRRSSLKLNAIGVSLAYFTSDFTRGDLTDGYSGWTKVFVGRFITEEYASSAINFFKLMPYREADVVSRDAQTLAQCLSHIKVRDARAAGQRYLLITEKVGAQDEMPISLEGLLKLSNGGNQNMVPAAVQQIARQLDRLDVASPNKLLPRELLSLSVMPNPDKAVTEIARNQIDRHATNLSELEKSLPFDVLEEILTLNLPISVKMKKCHGDLNASNVAVDIDEDGAKAYIFDASGMNRKPTEWDLAFLEVTTLLHTSSEGQSLVQACSELYGGDKLPQETSLASSVLLFISTIRDEALMRCTEEAYALLVFDITFGQVWGLAYGGSGNKVRVPSEAVRLLVLVSSWARKIIDGIPIRSDLDESPGF